MIEEPTTQAMPDDEGSAGSDQSAGDDAEIKSSNSYQYEVIAESFARITLAGFFGSLNGLALERRQQHVAQHHQAEDIASSGIMKKESSALSAHLRRHPPNAQYMLAQKQRANNYNNLPMTWALSCMAFVAILETCRVNSPTSKLLDTVSLDCTPASFDEEVRRTFLISIGDYSIGGIIAGLAGALAQRRPPSPVASSSAALRLPQTILQAGRRPLIKWGLGAGLGLGMVGGIFQSFVSVGNLYLQREQKQYHEANATK